MERHVYIQCAKIQLEIGANSCAKISFKYHHSNGGGGDGMNCGLVVKQNDDYFVQFFGVTGQASTIVKTMEKQLDVDSWLRVGGTQTTYYPNFDKPCSYGLIFANTSVSVVAYITDIKICLKHSCKVSDTLYASHTDEGAEQYRFVLSTVILQIVV